MTADTDDADAVIAAVRERVTPDEAERAAMRAAVEALTERAEAAIDELGLDADVVQVGSTARDTWLAGDRDIDLFVRLATDYDREELEAAGLAVGERVLPDGRQAYAEHPYVRGQYDGFAVDLVPCYDVEAATEIRTAVDRTPFHTAYLQRRLDAGTAGEVRALKQFLLAAGVYGSDLRTEGFSGYLTELLVLEHGDCAATLAAAADWQPPVRFDPEGHGTTTFDDPLTVVDPTDPGRNVAAVVSAGSLARLQHHARAFLAAPSATAFERSTPDPIDAAAVTDHLERRGTHPIALRVGLGPLVDDQLYPQLRRSLAGLERALDERGFGVLRAAAFATPLTTGLTAAGAAEASGTAPAGAARRRTPDVDGELPDDPTAAPRTAVLFFELGTGVLPAVERHEGPPVHVRGHAEAFLDAYGGGAAAARAADADGAGADAADRAVADRPLTYGPFVDGSRYVVEREREVRTARAVFASGLEEVALGAAIERAVDREYHVLEGEAVASLAERFGTDLARYFDPAP